MSKIIHRIDRYLDTNGDGTGTTSAIGNYSVTQGIFYIQPPSDDVFQINRLIVFVQDTGSFDSGSYGNGITLTNGITVRVQNNQGTFSDLTAGSPIKINPHWKRLCYDANVSAYGLGDESLGVRWTFSKAGYPIRLDGGSYDRIEVLLDDNFTGLVDHTFLVQGFVE